MFTINFYRDQQGREPVKEYFEELAKRTDKDSRIKLTKALDYIKILSNYGLSAGEPYIKHISDNVWELRPLRNRILFVAWHNNSFLLLHLFSKTTNKTPKKEIEQAKRNLKDTLDRSGLL